MISEYPNRIPSKDIAYTYAKTRLSVIAMQNVQQNKTRYLLPGGEVVARAEAVRRIKKMGGKL